MYYIPYVYSRIQNELAMICVEFLDTLNFDEAFGRVNKKASLSARILVS